MYVEQTKSGISARPGAWLGIPRDAVLQEVTLFPGGGIDRIVYLLPEFREPTVATLRYDRKPVTGLSCVR